MSLRQLMRVIGKLGATASAFSQARLQVRYLQNDLISNQRKGKSMFQNIKLSKKAKLELRWWIENIEIQNGRPMTLREPEMIIFSDAASSGGWGAECQGEKTGGQWGEEESDLHINILELLAAKFALKSFLSLRPAKAVHLMMDNTAAMSNIINMGGTVCPMMTEITKEIYSFLTSKGTTITLEYIPSELNKGADEESRKSKDSLLFITCSTMLKVLASSWMVRFVIDVSILELTPFRFCFNFMSRSHVEITYIKGWTTRSEYNLTHRLTGNLVVVSTVLCS